MKSTIMKKLVMAVLLLTSINAIAGKSCEEAAQKPDIVEKAVGKAVNVNEVLNNTNAKVVLIARIGQDLSKYHLKYSHVAFAYKNPDDQTWQVYHELNSCGSDQSNLYVEGLANFFLDDMVSYDSKIFIPSIHLQNKLYTLLTSRKNELKVLHESHYNMLAYPFSTKYQNSNQWVLEIIAKALNDSITDRNEAQLWLKSMHYVPTTLEIDTMTRLGARMFKANIAFDGQPFERRMAGHIDTITVDSVYNFLEQQDTEGKFIELTN